MEKKEGKQNKDNQKKKAGLVSELDSLQSTLIVWFFSTYTNPPTFFEARMLKSHLPMLHTASATLKLRKKSPLSSVSENQMYPSSTTQTKAFRETDVWVVEHLKWFSLLLQGSEKVHDSSNQDFGKKKKCNTGSLSHRKHRLAFQKSATVIASPHKGDTVPVYQPPVLSRQNVGDHFDKKKKKSFQKYVTSLHAQWASLKKHSVAKARVGWGLAFTAQLSI